jgi:hypothetical protein
MTKPARRRRALYRFSKHVAIRTASRTGGSNETTISCSAKRSVGCGSDITEPSIVPGPDAVIRFGGATANGCFLVGMR